MMCDHEVHPTHSDCRPSSQEEEAGEALDEPSISPGSAASDGGAHAPRTLVRSLFSFPSYSPAGNVLERVLL